MTCTVPDGYYKPRIYWRIEPKTRAHSECETLFIASHKSINNANSFENELIFRPGPTLLFCYVLLIAVRSNAWF